MSRARPVVHERAGPRPVLASAAGGRGEGVASESGVAKMSYTRGVARASRGAWGRDLNGGAITSTTWASEGDSAAASEAGSASWARSAGWQAARLAARKMIPTA